jgi:N-acetylmuramoyl-L-alanine amidase CwlA
MCASIFFLTCAPLLPSTVSLLTRLQNVYGILIEKQNTEKKLYFGKKKVQKKPKKNGWKFFIVIKYSKKLLL